MTLLSGHAEGRAGCFLSLRAPTVDEVALPERFGQHDVVPHRVVAGAGRGVRRAGADGERQRDLVVAQVDVGFLHLTGDAAVAAETHHQDRDPGGLGGEVLVGCEHPDGVGLRPAQDTARTRREEGEDGDGGGGGTSEPHAASPPGCAPRVQTGR